MGKITKYILFIFLISAIQLKAQLCPECDISCVICDDLDGYTDNNGSDEAGVGPPDFCTIVQHQMLWLGFIAGSEDLSIQVDVGPCMSASLEVGIFEAIDCDSPSLISNCYGGAIGNQLSAGQSGVVTANQPLVVGQYYFLVFDMTSGPPANCDFSLSVVNGSTGAGDIEEIAVLEGPETLCDGETYNFVPEIDADITSYEWELDGNSMGDALSYDFEETEPGTYTLCASPYNACSEGEQVCTEITVGESYEEYYYVQACYEDCAVFEGELYCNDGERDFEYETIYGCDSIIYLEIEWYNSEDEHYLGEFVLCSGEVLEYEDEEYYASGTYFVELEDPNECDSIVEFDLIILDTIVVNLVDSICRGDVYVWSMDTLTDSGMYSDTSISMIGCDSITHLDLTVIDRYDVQVDAEICNQQAYSVGDSIFTIAGSYEIGLQASNGCDSVVFLNLEIADTIFVDYSEFLCAGDTLLFNDSLLIDSGVYRFDHISGTGCDSIEMLELNILSSTDTLISETVCAGESIMIDNRVYDATGNFEHILDNTAGCDSIVYLELIVMDSIIEYPEYRICPGDSVSIYGEYYKDEGNFTKVGIANNGCDSLIKGNIVFLESYEYIINEELCEGESLIFEGSEYSETGSFVHKFNTVNGCDSLRVLDLNILDTTHYFLKETVCDDESFMFDGNLLDTAGVYEFNYTNVLGCDSIIYLQLDIVETFEGVIAQTICSGDSIFFVDEYLYDSGTYERGLMSLAGCDSTVILELEVREHVTRYLDDSFCEFDSYDFNGMMLSDSGVYEQVFEAANGCDSTVVLNLTMDDCSAIYNVTSMDPECWDSEDGSIAIEIESGQFPVTVFWENTQDPVFSGSFQLDESMNKFVIFQLAGGEYDLRITDALGEESIETVILDEVDELQISVSLSDFQGYNVSCFGSDDGWVELEIEGGTEPYGIAFWNDAYFGYQRSFLNAGEYSITLSDANGCEVEVEFEMTEPDPIVFSYELEVIDPCNSNESRMDLTLEGGAGTADYTILDPEGNIQTQDILVEGMNTLIMKDGNGCETVEEIFIESFNELIVDLGEDVTLEQGETFYLEPQTNFDIASLDWLTIPYTDICMDCSSLNITAQDDLSVIVETFDEKGCSVLDTLFIKVLEPIKYFTPNSIQLSSVPPNNRFNVYFNYDVSIESFQIFSRWGELVYSNNNIKVNDSSDGWDGYMNGRKVEQGVYVYKISYLDRNGETEVIVGDLTVFR